VSHVTRVASGAVLAAWESALSARGQQRALSLLGPLGGGEADRPLGQRDAMLLSLYRDLHGPVLEALATCPGCRTTLEIRLAVADLTDGYGDLALGDSGPPAGRYRPTEQHEADLGSVRVTVRCPTSADLLALAGEADVAAARAALVDRCVLAIRRQDGSARALDDSEVRRLGTVIEELDPLADVRVGIACAECGHAWSALLDVPELVWALVQGTARRLLSEIDALAQRYGWSEAEILSLSDQRRRAYLDLR
jgi:hypothetical protein